MLIVESFHLMLNSLGFSPKFEIIDRHGISDKIDDEVTSMLVKE